MRQGGARRRSEISVTLRVRLQRARAALVFDDLNEIDLENILAEDEGRLGAWR